MSFDSNNRSSAENDTIEMQTYPVLDAGVYRARLETIDNREGKYGEALQFNWRVVGGDSDGELFSAWVNKKLMPKSKLATWTKAHLNINAFPAGFVLNVGSLIGKEVHITLTVEPRKDGGGDVNVVQAVSPYKPATKKAKAPEPPQEQPQEQPAAADAFGEAFEEIPDPDYPPIRAKKVA
jgi:hypothetical protein